MSNYFPQTSQKTNRCPANRVGEIFSPLSHHRTCGSAYGGSYFGFHSRYESSKQGKPAFLRLAVEDAICMIGEPLTLQ